MPTERFDPHFSIDFNLHHVPAALGFEVTPEAGAAIVGLDRDEFVAYTASVEAAVRETASRLLEDSDLAGALENLGVPRGGTVLTVGDSITTYRRGYAEVLRAMLELQPEHRIHFRNAAHSGFNSMHGKELTFTQLLALDPDLVTIMFGANDTKRFGGRSERTLVSAEEYRANLESIVGGFAAHTHAQVVLIAPAPVVELVVGENPAYQEMRMYWDNADLRALGPVLREVAEAHEARFIDFYALFGDTPDPALFMPDGVHPNPDGHERMLRALLAGLGGRGADGHAHPTNTTSVSR